MAALEVRHKIALRVVATCDVSALVSNIVATTALGHLF